MSADRWTVCPRCLKVFEESLELTNQDIENSYGKVSMDEFLLRKEAYEKFKNSELGDNLREDWEIYINDSGKLFIKYSCYCNRCAFLFRFDHEVNVLE